jgi:Na+-driven multidrug efflux pump
MTVQPPARPRPDAVQTDPRRIVAVGMALFFVAFLALLPFYTWLGTHHHRVWLWTALAGWLLGFVGWALMRKHRREGRTI